MAFILINAIGNYIIVFLNLTLTFINLKKITPEIYI